MTKLMITSGTMNNAASNEPDPPSGETPKICSMKSTAPSRFFNLRKKTNIPEVSKEEERSNRQHSQQVVNQKSNNLLRCDARLKIGIATMASSNLKKNN